MRRRLRPGTPPSLAATTASLVTVTVTVTALVTGCASAAQGVSPPLRLGSAYVIAERGLATANAYLVISNPGAADRLLRVTSSAGGEVTLRGPSRPGSPTAPALSGLTVPGHSFVRLDPTGVHLVLSSTGPMRQGSEITLTLKFAHAGVMRVTAQVTDLGVDGGSAVSSDNS